MKPVKFVEKIQIHCSAQHAFDYTQDYSNRLRWDTFLKRAELMDGAVAADLGVRAHCVAKNGMGMETEYVSFNRPKATAVKMTKGPFMFRAFAGSWTFVEVAPSTTDVTFTYSFRLRFPVSLVMGFVNMVLRRNVRQRLVDLKNNLEKAE